MIPNLELGSDWYQSPQNGPKKVYIAPRSENYVGDKGLLIYYVIQFGGIGRPLHRYLIL